MKRKELLLISSVVIGDVETVKKLIERGVDINQRTKNMMTPLMIACKTDELEIVKFLVEKGAKLDLQDENGRTSLMWAVLRNNVEMVRNLIEAGANIDIQDKNGETSLTKAGTKAGTNEEIIYLLINKRENKNILDKILLALTKPKKS